MENIKAQITLFSTAIKEVITPIFLIIATVTGIIVAVKFVNSRDKKEAVNYAVWWVAGIVFFFSLNTIVEELREKFD